MQIFMSASVALLLEMISMAIQLYTEVSFVDKITLKNISSTDIDDSHRLKSIFSVPQGTVGILIMSMSSIVILLAVEHYILGAHRCLRPRHLLGCCEISTVVFQSLSDCS